MIQEVIRRQENLAGLNEIIMDRGDNEGFQGLTNGSNDGLSSQHEGMVRVPPHMEKTENGSISGPVSSMFKHEGMVRVPHMEKTENDVVAGVVSGSVPSLYNKHEGMVRVPHMEKTENDVVAGVVESVVSGSVPLLYNKVERISMANLTEHIIELIRQYPILYDSGDPEYKNMRKKDQIWDIIGRELGESGNIIKTKWKSLRDNYTKHLRSLHTSAGPVHIKINNYKSWPWAKQMEVFRPYMKSASNVSHNGDIEVSDQVSEELVVQPEVTIEDGTAVNGVKKRRRGKKRACPDPSVEQLISYLPEPHHDPHRDHDAIELMFLGLAKTIKTFSPKRQALTKMKIATMVMEQEYEQREEEERWSSGASSNGSRAIMADSQGPTFPSTSTHPTQPSAPFSTQPANPFHWPERSIR